MQTRHRDRAVGTFSLRTVPVLQGGCMAKVSLAMASIAGDTGAESP
jgi:hypothetical protein